MSDVADLLFARILIKNRVVTKPQVHEAIEKKNEYVRRGFPRTLGEILQEMGALAHGDVLVTLEAQALSEVLRQDILYGRLAIRSGAIHQAQFEEALWRQKAGAYAQRVGEVLVHQGILSPTQHKQFLLALAQELKRSAIPSGTSTRIITPTLGENIGAYHILEKLGEGRAAEVYKAEGPSGEQVAVKVLKPWARLDEESLRLVPRKVPGMVEILDVGEQDGRFYLLLECVDGETLEEYRPPTLQAAGKVLVQAAKAMRALHRAGTTHGQIRPSNVMVTGEGRVYLMEPGLVWTEEEEDSADDPYRPPELEDGGEPDESADIYALGVVAYTVLAGPPSFAPLDIEEGLLGEGDMARGMERILRGCTAVSRDRRYRAGELVADLEALNAGKTPRGPASAAQGVVRSLGRSLAGMPLLRDLNPNERRVLGVAAVLALLIVLAGLILF